MHNAPSVSYPVGRCAFVGWFLAGMTALAVGLQTGWALAWWPGGAWVPSRWAVSSGVWGLTLGWAWWHWWRSPVGWLIWAPWLTEDPPDTPKGGAGWWWGTRSGTEGEAVARVRPMALGGAWVVLHVTLVGGGRARGRWVWALARSAPDRWLPLRRALTRHAG